MGGASSSVRFCKRQEERSALVEQDGPQGFEMVRVNQIFEFHLSLAEVRPAVWRRIQVPADYTLARLHKVIQIVMDWQDCHLDEFTVDGRSYGAPDPEDDRFSMSGPFCGTLASRSETASSMSMTSATTGNRCSSSKECPNAMLMTPSQFA